MRLAVKASDVSKVYVANGQVIHAIRSASFEIPEGAFVSLIGPSGCGKSTLLKMIGGLDEKTDGTLLYQGSELNGINQDVGYVPQHDHLLPWRSVRRNVALGLELRGVRDSDVRKRVDELLKVIGLSAFAENYPAQLSGGMRKRVALARAFAYRPRCLLMDEPFGALDAQMKIVMHQELLRIWEGERQTIVFVTHDLEEAILLSDLVIVMSKAPSTIKAIEHVQLARPRHLERDRFSPAFQALHSRLWALIDQELLEARAVA